MPRVASSLTNSLSVQSNEKKYFQKAMNMNHELYSREDRGQRPSFDDRERRLFRALDLDNCGAVVVGDLLSAIEEIGISRNDLRLRETVSELSNIEPSEKISIETFCQIVRPNILLIEQALQGKVAIPDFPLFCSEIERIYEATRDISDGEVASYIPRLAEVSPEHYGVAFCTVDGQRGAFGDVHKGFSVQSCFKPITYCLALEEHGADYVHRYVGREPSGLNFNELALGKDGEPHNPMINAGAIMCSSMVKPELDLALRFDHLLSNWERLCGNRRPRLSNTVYQSERSTADRNYALGYFMREHHAFPPGTDMLETLEFYFQSCSLELDVDSMAVLAATLANGGVCPTTGDRVFCPSTVQHCLSLMVSCGMYDFSGEFAFSVGLPAKSGVGGGMMVVVPNVMGFCIWSPRLDSRGNPVRGIAFCEELVSKFNLHNYDVLTSVSNKTDPRISRAEQKAKVGELIWAASKGDHGATHRLVIKGYDQDCSDYDGRTPLHLAAAEGHEQIVRHLVGNGAEVNPMDRWGATPMDDACRFAHENVMDYLRENGGRRELLDAQVLEGQTRVQLGRSTSKASESPLIVELIYAASEGDLLGIRRLVARGAPLDQGDYDLRTPLHLAAAEGHEPVVRYLIDQGVPKTPRDRWGGLPLDDARRHGHHEVVKLLDDWRFERVILPPIAKGQESIGCSDVRMLW